MNDSKFKIEKAKDRQKLSWEQLTYSERRIDLLLISISGAGIYVCLETIRFLSEKESSPHFLIWISSTAFLCSIILNFIGQFQGRKSNYYDFLMCQAEIDSCEEPNNTLHKQEMDKYDSLSEKYNKRVAPINIICTSLMIIGIAAILGYFLLVF